MSVESPHELDNLNSSYCELAPIPPVMDTVLESAGVSSVPESNVPTVSE